MAAAFCSTCSRLDAFGMATTASLYITQFSMSCAGVIPYLSRSACGILLAARDELLHGLHRLLDGDLVARPVQLVKVDVLDAQALYAALARGQDVFVPKVLRRDLTGDEDFVP